MECSHALPSSFGGTGTIDFTDNVNNGTILAMRFSLAKRSMYTKMLGRVELPMEGNLSSFQQGSSMPESVS